MSALVDIWTKEVSKLRDKDQTIYSASAATQHESALASQEKDNNSSGVPVLGKLMQFNKPRFMFSEASLSMFVQCFNP
uniref:Uncharacterized protein n=1 Tax=Cajanus cajan TaxID=3821 RepID=A0A151TG59_CAJCA|nr:hypothetical protein KK1_012296 [Cajanus cajan]